MRIYQKTEQASPLQSFAGNTLIEYVMIGGICTLAIAGLCIAGTDLQSMLRGLRLEMRQSIAAARVDRSPKPVVPVQQILPQGEPGPPPPPPTSNPYLTPELMPAYQNYKQSGNMKGMVETAGANGATRALAGDIEMMAYGMLAAGTITQEEANALFELANRGHRIAEVEQLAEDAFASCNGDVACFNNTKVMFDGEEQEIKYLIDNIANTHSYSSTADALMSPVPNSTMTGREVLLNDPTTHGFGLLNDFLAQYQALKDSSLLNNPETRKMIDDMTVEIELLASETAQFVSDFSGGRLGPTATSDAMTNNIASDVTHYNSKEFCVAGSGTDTGTLCQ